MKKIFIISFLYLSFIYCGLNIPIEGDTLNLLYVQFNWDQEPDAIEYNLQVSNDLFFTDIIIDDYVSTLLYIDKDNLDWDNQYFWRLRPKKQDNIYGNWIDTLSFFTNNAINDPGLVEIDIYDSNNYHNGTIMYGDFYEYVSIGYDRGGREIWNSGNQNFNVVRINNGVELLGVSNNNGLYTFLENDFKMNEIWDNEISGINLHDLIKLPNGNYMALQGVWQQGPIPQGSWSPVFQLLGYQSDGVTNEFTWRGFKIVEYDKDTRDIIWDWNSFEHFSMDDYDTLGGTWQTAIQSTSYDWLHANSLWFDESDSSIYVSSRHLSRITKIDYLTGEIIWNMGLENESNSNGQNICTDLNFSWQHDFRVLHDNEFLLFDNGNLSTTVRNTDYPTTRILHFEITDDMYCNIIWEYDFSENLFSQAMGSVELLNNGNYLACLRADGGHITEVNTEKEVVYDMKLNNNQRGRSNYRAFNILDINPNSFSFLLDGYKEFTFEGNNYDGIEIIDEFKFTIHNQGEYDETYYYILSDENNLFINNIGSINISGSDSNQIIINQIDHQIKLEDCVLEIYSSKFQNDIKRIEFNVVFLNNIYDVNEDGAINVVDIISIVDAVIDGSTPVEYDVNQDGIVNIIDVITIINFILN